MAMVDTSYPYAIITKRSIQELAEAVREALRYKRGHIVLVGGPFKSCDDSGEESYSQAVALPEFT